MIATSMHKTAFKVWYKARGRSDDTILTDALRVNKEIADLDGSYKKDRLKSVIQLLQYSKGDERVRRKNTTGMKYESKAVYDTEEYYKRLSKWCAAYKSAVEAYRDFRDQNTDLLVHPDESNEHPFDPSDDSDGREKIIQAIYARRGQEKFRKALRKAYNDRCAISGCDVLDVLEAAHIKPWRGAVTDHVSNGLLLRADLHTLFDCGLITIEPGTLCVIVSEVLFNSEYRYFNGRALARTVTKASSPNREAVNWHKKNVYDKRCN